MLRVEVKVADPSNRIAEVEVNGEKFTLGLSQTRTFSVPDNGELKVKVGEQVEYVQKDQNGDVVTDTGPGLHGNPNGIQQAEIAPRMPGGNADTTIVLENGEYVEKTPGDLAVMRKGGGAESPTSVTPGPKPSEEEGPAGTVKTQAHKK